MSVGRATPVGYASTSAKWPPMAVPLPASERTFKCLPVGQSCLLVHPVNRSSDPS